MSFRELYTRVQSQGDRISTKWLKSQVIDLSPIKSITEFWSGTLDPEILRGFYIEGPFNSIPSISVSEHQALIGLSRDMCHGKDGKNWRRAIFTKEMMHCFDLENQKVDSPDKLDTLIDGFKTAESSASSEFQSESIAHWRSLAVLCKESRRVEILEQHKRCEISPEVAGASLGIPAYHVHDLLRDDFSDLIASILD